MPPPEKPPDYIRSGVVAGLTVVAAIVLFFIAKGILSFLLEHWILTLFVVLGGVGFGLYWLIKDGRPSA
ncbi:MAG: hypothetical protein QM796_00470 [Chthoniobacteraceae bacterium]